jgi:hypothetical protein
LLLLLLLLEFPPAECTDALDMLLLLLLLPAGSPAVCRLVPLLVSLLLLSCSFSSLMLADLFK